MAVGAGSLVPTTVCPRISAEDMPTRSVSSVSAVHSAAPCLSAGRWAQWTMKSVLATLLLVLVLQGRSADGLRLSAASAFGNRINSQALDISGALPARTGELRAAALGNRAAAGAGLLPDGGVSPCVIKVVGVGGGGGNAVLRMIQTGVSGVDFVAVNTDLQALNRFENIAQTLNIGKDVTRGLGAGGIADNGRKAAEESRVEIGKLVQGSDLVFVTAGMGGGTGSGAAPVVAEVAREHGALTVGVVTKPFAFEGKRRMQQALQAIERLRSVVDTLIIVSNDRLLQIIPENTPLQSAFAVADDVLRQGVVGISEIIIRPGLINVDFADVRTIMGDAGTALMGIGRGNGRTRARDAAAAAISSPLLDFPIEKAKGVVFNIVGGSDLTLQEVNAAADVIYEAIDPDANIIFGALVDDTMQGDVAITVIATGFPIKDGESAPSAATGRATVGNVRAPASSGSRKPPPAPAGQPSTLSQPTHTTIGEAIRIGARQQAVDTEMRSTEAPLPPRATVSPPASRIVSTAEYEDVPEFLEKLRKLRSQ